MALPVASCMLTLAVVLAPVPCQGSSKFLHDKGGSVNAKAFKEDIMNAMGSILGCGGKPEKEQIDAIKAVLNPMWQTMPKSSGRIDRRSLRYLVHRYFMQTSSLMVRGFEPTRPVNDTNWGAADILSQMVPAYVESVLESQHNTQNGFSLQDAIDMVLTLDQLIFDAESSLLEDTYKSQRKLLQRSLSAADLKQVLEEYMIKWMVDATPEEHGMLLANKSLAEEVMPHYRDLMQFAEGRIKAVEYARQGKVAKGQGQNMLAMMFSFKDAHEVVGGITRSFQSYWQSECDSMKTSLMSMDKYNTGRVPLSKFYNTAINTDWRFGESESYLRELGALDETSRWLGPQVIIPNYLQATSNCIVSTPHYLVCCVNECESLLGEIESAIQTPTALPSTILATVRNMTAQTTLDDDQPPNVDKRMIEQLEQVAKNHGGMVPLHGRLFAQWLHYVFPRECPFPHKSGVVTSATPSEYGDNFIASHADMKAHAVNADDHDAKVSVGKEELQWMSQWSPDEELMVDYRSELSGKGQWSRFLGMASLVLLAGGIWGGVFKTSSKQIGSSNSMANSHAHWV